MADFKIGDRAKIVGNQSGHRFQMYETVEITGIPGDHPENTISGYSVKGEKRVGFVLTKDLEVVSTTVRVLELQGIKLDPKANYLIVFNEEMIRRSDMVDVYCYFRDELKVKGVSLLRCSGDPSLAVKVFQVPKEK